jgi:hypothetical protein
MEVPVSFGGERYRAMQEAAGTKEQRFTTRAFGLARSNIKDTRNAARLIGGARAQAERSIPSSCACASELWAASWTAAHSR